MALCKNVYHFPSNAQCNVCVSMSESLQKKSRVRQDAETTVSIVQSVIQSVSKSVNSLASGSFELSSKRNSLSPWCINSACALFPTPALLQSKEVGLPSIQIFSFVPMFSWHVRVSYVCVTVHVGARVCMLVAIMSGCMFIYVGNRICTVIHPLIVCVCLFCTLG